MADTNKRLSQVQIDGEIYDIKDPEINDWARADVKPTYSAEEIAAMAVKKNGSSSSKNADEIVVLSKDNTLETSGETFEKLYSRIDKATVVDTVANGEWSINIVNDDGSVNLSANYYTIEHVNNIANNIKSDIARVESDINTTINRVESGVNDSIARVESESNKSISKVETKLDNAKVDKQVGKGLSTNDFTDAYKTKLEGIQSGANKYTYDDSRVLGEISTIKNRIDNIVIPSKLSELESDSSHETVTAKNKTDWNGKYSKPKTGIPMSDLDSNTQFYINKVVNSNVANNVVTLTPSGLLPESVIPGNTYNEVRTYNDVSDFPKVGTGGSLYLVKGSSTAYMYNGSTYTQINGALTLGIDSSNAFYGDKGYAAYTHANNTDGIENPHHITPAMIGLGNVQNMSASEIIGTIQSEDIIEKLSKESVLGVIGASDVISNLSEDETTGQLLYNGEPISTSVSVGDLEFNPEESYPDGSVGHKLQNIGGTAEDISFDPNAVYSEGTVGHRIQNLGSSADRITYDTTEEENYATETVGGQIFEIKNRINDLMLYAAEVETLLDMIVNGATAVMRDDIGYYLSDENDRPLQGSIMEVEY